MTPSRIENTIPPISTAKPEDQRRLEYREKALDRHLHFAVVDVGDAVEHFLEPARFLANQDHLRRQPRVQSGLGKRTAETLAFAQPRDHAVERLRQHAVAHRVLDDREAGKQRDAVGEQRGERAREARDLDLGHQVADERHAQHAAIPAEAYLWIAQAAADEPDHRDDDR